eukprot:SAG25_NODE_1538_length_2827_cov_1.687317_2_plen_53_part_01
MEEEVPSPTLFDGTTQERAIVQMWQRRVEQEIFLSKRQCGLARQSFCACDEPI